jgi:hypothetical protein
LLREIKRLDKTLRPRECDVCEDLATGFFLLDDFPRTFIALPVFLFPALIGIDLSPPAFSWSNTYAKRRKQRSRIYSSLRKQSLSFCVYVT